MTMGQHGVVAVIIPTHNRRALVLQAARSVLAQTYPYLKCIIVDNGSQDGTAQALAGLEDPRLSVVLEGQLLGPAGARNRGLEEAGDADWVAFLDSDDLWAPTKLEAQLAGMGETSAQLSLTASLRVGPDLRPRSAGRYRYDLSPGSPVYVITQRALLDQLAAEHFIPVLMSTLLGARALLSEIGGFDAGLEQGEDWDLVLRLARLSDIAYIDLPLVAYRQWPGQVTSDWKDSMRGNFAVRARHLGSRGQLSVTQRKGWAVYVARNQVRDGNRLAACREFGKVAWLGRAPGQLAYALGALVAPSLIEKRLQRFDDLARTSSIPLGWAEREALWLSTYQSDVSS